jgi:protein phosphatase
LGADGAVGSGLLWLDAAGASDQGARGTNEDAFLADVDRAVFAVVDGMGGEGGGELAARVTLEAIKGADRPRDALRQAAQAIGKQAAGKAALASMGAVATVVRAQGGRLRIAHCGDTRAYLVTALGCEQLTRDHTVAHAEQERLSLTQAALTRGRNVVTRDLGIGSSVDEAVCGWAAGDLLFLCTDGVHGAFPSGELSDRLIAARLAHESPRGLVDDLLRLSRARGTGDNATAVAVFHRGDRDVSSRNRFGALAVLLPLLALVLGILVGPRIAPWRSPMISAPPTPSVRVEVIALPEPRPRVEVLRGPALPAKLAGDIALGATAFRVDEPAEISVPPNPFEIRGLEVSGRSPRLTFRLPEGANLTLSLSRLDLPRTDVEFVLEGPLSSLRLATSVLLARSLRFSGPAGARAVVDRSTEIRLEGRARPFVEGVTFARESAR